MQVIKRFTNEAIEGWRGERRRETPVPDERSSASVALFEELTPRELEVLSLMVQGKSNPEIAHVLAISRATAKVHVGHIINKLGVSDRIQAVVRAIELGLVVSETDR